MHLPNTGTVGDIKYKKVGQTLGLYHLEFFQVVSLPVQFVIPAGSKLLCRDRHLGGSRWGFTFNHPYVIILVIMSFMKLCQLIIPTCTPK